MNPPAPLDGLDHVALYVKDLSVSERWYIETLGLRRVHANVWGRQPVMLVAGRSGVALFQAKTSESESPRPSAVAGTMSHLAFHVPVDSLDAWRAALSDRGIAVEFQDHQVTRSLYFRDPDGHLLELTTETSSEQPAGLEALAHRGPGGTTEISRSQGGQAAAATGSDVIH